MGHSHLVMSEGPAAAVLRGPPEISTGALPFPYSFVSPEVSWRIRLH